MADDIDVANDLVDNEVARALSKIRQNTLSVGTKLCVECGDDMPPARQKLGFKLCVCCAEERERRGQLYAD